MRSTLYKLCTIKCFSGNDGGGKDKWGEINYKKKKKFRNYL